MAFCTEIVRDGCGECISRTKICSKERMTRIARETAGVLERIFSYATIAERTKNG